MAELIRRLDVRDAVVIGAGSMVGAGVFAVWAPAAAAAGDWLLIGLLIAGIVATCNATSSAQLAARHPESGGTYVYASIRLGPSWGHVAGWGFVVGKTASIAAMASVVGAHIWADRADLVASIAIVVVMAINIGGLERTVGVTRILLVVALTTIGISIAAGLTGGPTATIAVDINIDGGVFGVIRSAGLLFFAFAGYARIATLGEEVIDPARTIPRAVPRALGAVLALYAVVGAVVISHLGSTGLAASATPVADVVATRGWRWAEPIVAVGATVASAGVMLNLVPGVARTVVAMARRGDMPSTLAHIDGRRALPLRAEFTVAVVAIIVVNALSLTSSIAVSGVAVLTYYALTNAAALRLRASETLWPRWVAWLGLVGCVILIASLPTSSLIGGVAVLVSGIAIRFLAVRRCTSTVA